MRTFQFKKYLQQLHLKYVVTVVTIMCFNFTVHGQIDFAYPIVADMNNNVMVDPTPEAQSMGKYGDIKVSNYTGTVNVPIPIYSFNSQKLGMDINLVYTTGGVKVSEESSWVGQGWTLQAGGVITRTVIGKPDSEGHYYSKAAEIDTYRNPLPGVNPDQEWFYKQVADGDIETQTDMYHYNFNGRVGKFYITPQKDIVKK